MSNPPNILIFMTDQQRGDTVLQGSPLKALTPNLDRFQKSSVTFTQAHCPSPHCCPSRATFLTGLYPSQHGVWNNVGVPNRLSAGLAPGVSLWSESLKESGYQLYYSGKWHISSEEGPQNRGWDTKGTVYGEEVSYLCSEDDAPRIEADDWPGYEKEPSLDVPESRKTAEIFKKGYGKFTLFGVDEDYFNDRGVVEDAKRAIRKYSKETSPWCVYVGTLGPHDPYFVPQEFLDLYPIDSIELPGSFQDMMEDKPGLYRRTRDQFGQLSDDEHREAVRHYLAFCSFQDALFGDVLDALEASGKAEDTVVLYCSDHGDYVGDHRLWTKGLPCFKGAYNIPFIIKDPNAPESAKGSTVEAFVSLADFGPTIAEMTGLPAIEGSPGRSLVPFLKGETPSEWRDAYFTQSNGNEIYGIQRSITTRDWKFVYNGFDFDEFYDLKNDPNEEKNLIHYHEYSDLADEGMRRIWEFSRVVEDKNTNSYIMVSIARLGPGTAFERSR